MEEMGGSWRVAVMQSAGMACMAWGSDRCECRTEWWPECAACDVAATESIPSPRVCAIDATGLTCR